MTTPLLENILAQPRSLDAVLLHVADDSDAFKEAAQMIRDCLGRVIVSGMGASHFAATAAAYTLQQAGVPVLCMESAELLHYGADLPRQGDVAILVSRSGGSVEVVSLLPVLRSRGVRVISVSNDAASELARAGDVSLVLGSAVDQMVAVQTYTATALVLQLLAQFVAGRALKDLLIEGREGLQHMQGMIDECAATRAGWRQWLQHANPPYLLARGGSLASALEGALLFHETAKAPAVAMSSGQFRHGPVEAVDRAFTAIVFAGSAQTSRLAAGLANDLSTMGARVLWLGADPAAGAPALVSAVQRLSTWPSSVAVWLTPLLEVVPLQFAAYELALVRGVHPGDFRYTPQVTTSEEGFASVAPVVSPVRTSPAA